MKEPKYKVILSGSVIPERSREEVLKGLADLFNSTTTAMERVLQGHQTPLKKEYSESQATEFCQKIRMIGAQCQIEEIRIDKTVEEIVEEATEETIGRKHEAAHGYDPERIEEGKMQSLLMGFVGVNTDYYRRQFARFGSPYTPSFRLTWHWPAFFFFFFWALYRKMWGLAGFYIIVGTSLTTITSSPGFSLVWLLVWPCTANYLYYRKAAAGIHRVVENPGMEVDYLRRGGVSKGAVWVGVVIMMILFWWVGNHVARQLVEEYGEDIKGVLPGSGSQMNRDGSVMELTPNSEAELVESSLTLSYLAASLKLLIVAQGRADNNTAVTEFIERLNQGKYYDGWGNEILLTQEVDRYVLFSAGPDQTYGTGDDILQAVNLR